MFQPIITETRNKQNGSEPLSKWSRIGQIGLFPPPLKGNEVIF